MARKSIAEQVFKPEELIEIASLHKRLNDRRRSAKDKTKDNKLVAGYFPKMLQYAATLERVLNATEEAFANQTVAREALPEKVQQLQRMAAGFATYGPLERLYNFGTLNERDADLVRYFGILFSDSLGQLVYGEMADHKFDCTVCNQTFFVPPTIENIGHPEKIVDNLRCPVCMGKAEVWCLPGMQLSSSEV